MAVVSSSSASVAVEKATSDLLVGPDWTMNIDICDSLNSNRWLAKDVMKTVKKRLQHKNPKVQLLALTLLETMVKNCGDYVHFQIAEKNILGEMVRIVKKKTDMHVREKILVVLDSWQEAFGGPGGKHPQYYWAYEELRRTGVEFPQRSLNASPIFTPPVAYSTTSHAQVGYGMPSNSSRRLDETMAIENEGLSLSILDSMRSVVELLGDMLQAVSPNDREAVKDEIIVDLVNQCRSNQKRLMHMLTTTGEEELLAQGLELNDSLQILLAKHDAIASGNPMPTQLTDSNPKRSEGCSSKIKRTEVKQSEVKDSGSSPGSDATVSGNTTTKIRVDEEDEEEDDFAQLARRHSKPQSNPSQTTYSTSDVLVPVDTSNVASSSSMPAASTPATCNALVLPDPPAPVKTTKELDIIDLLSITLSTSSSPHHLQTPYTPLASNPSMSRVLPANQSMNQIPASSSQGYPCTPQFYPGNQGQAAYNSYVVPWAQPQSQQLAFQSPPQLPQIQQQMRQQSQVQPQTMSQLNQNLQPQPQLQQQFPPQSQPEMYPQPQPQFPPHSLSETHLQPQAQARALPQQQFPYQPQQHFQPQLQSQYPDHSSGYPPPPWAATPGYANGQYHTSTISNILLPSQTNAATSYTPAQASRPMQHRSSFDLKGSRIPALNGNPWASPGHTNSASSGQKPFIPSYRLFEDLNVLGNTDARFKMTGNTTPNLSGPSSQGMVGGRK